jgi:histone H3/H4
MIDHTLHEIRFYQSNAAAESFMIPQKSFERLVRQVCEEVRLECRIYDYGVRWERDALIALQTMSEHVLTMSFELLYFVFEHPADLTDKNYRFMQSVKLS